jgi:hypothetical protein
LQYEFLDGAYVTSAFIKIAIANYSRPNDVTWLIIGNLGLLTLMGKRNRKKPSVSMSQRSSSPLLDRSSSTTMNIMSFPPEVFEVVVGAMSFVDLPYFVQSSKTINVPRSLISQLTRSACSKELDMGQELLQFRHANCVNCMSTFPYIRSRGNIGARKLF